MTQKKRSFLILCSIALGAFIIVCIFNISFEPLYDLQFFKRWGNKVLNRGFGAFYEPDPVFTSDYSTDYPPVYILCCTLMAALNRLINPNAATGFSETYNTPNILESFLFRLPSALILVGCIFIFYYLIKSFKTSDRKALLVTAVFAFAPAIIITIICGMADTFTVFFVLLSLLMFVKNKYLLSMLSCSFGILTKIQFVFILPVIGFAIIYKMYKNKQLIKFFKYLAVCLIVYIAVYTPFIYKEVLSGRIFYLFEILFKIFSHHNRFSIAAFNFYTAIGINNISYKSWYMAINILILFTITLISIWLFIKKPTNENVVLLSAFIVTAIFMFLTNMHDRYMLPVIGAMLVAAHIVNTKKLLIVNYFFYSVQFLNSIYLIFFFNGSDFTKKTDAIILSILSVTAFVLFAYETISYAFKKESRKKDNLSLIAGAAEKETL